LSALVFAAQSPLFGLAKRRKQQERYVNPNRIFFSAWDCKDVCSVFYDMIGIIHVLTKRDLHIYDLYLSFDVDLRTEAYVFLTGDTAGSFGSLWISYAEKFTKLLTTVSIFFLSTTSRTIQV
jgi:hypothetical protein